MACARKGCPEAGGLMPMEKPLGPVALVKLTPMIPGRQLPPGEKLMAPETY
ncbi:Hypothetical protein AA314_02859 [Archangium gephyra]|uniref:Uncharacterized protein n=1 Tax=Archangium gephyra TaxID=48 RepID=A0AAC8Q550_9BACT|nr:Hypothetical protein AA314_02859 [Archangium gephyra]